MIRAVGKRHGVMALASGSMNAPDKDIHERVFDEIQARIKSFQSGAPAADPNRGAWTQGDVAAELAQLEIDRDLLHAHWMTQDGASSLDTPPRSRACGETQPCSHVLALKKQFCP